jgi:hypothetical protein
MSLVKGMNIFCSYPSGVREISLFQKNQKSASLPTPYGTHAGQFQVKQKELGWLLSFEYGWPLQSAEI